MPAVRRARPRRRDARRARGGVVGAAAQRRGLCCKTNAACVSAGVIGAFAQAGRCSADGQNDQSNLRVARAGPCAEDGRVNSFGGSPGNAWRLALPGPSAVGPSAYGETFHGTPGFSWSGIGDCARFRNASAPNGGAARIEGSRCGGVPDWRRSLIIVDFHEPRGLLKFHHAFMPKLHELREKYAAAGCAMQLGTVLRDSTSQMLSEYLYFHVQFSHSLHGNATKQ